uniref:Uncharacterized protein n=1 Tax=Rousettus aegyptiacus TaxID=9407 RepID=A0A7J8ILB6_ROUAE|nr:hypothetical protein HJG63_010604 [Rousettus aegyptiacus]
MWKGKVYLTFKVVGTEKGMWPLKTLLLHFRQEINNRNCRVRMSKTLTEQGLRREVSQDGSSLQNQRCQQAQRGNHYPISQPSAQSHTYTSTSPCQEARERGSETLYTAPSTRRSRTETVLRVAGSN